MMEHKVVWVCNFKIFLKVFKLFDLEAGFRISVAYFDLPPTRAVFFVFSLNIQ